MKEIQCQYIRPRRTKLTTSALIRTKRRSVTSLSSTSATTRPTRPTRLTWTWMVSDRMQWQVPLACMGMAPRHACYKKTLKCRHMREGLVVPSKNIRRNQSQWAMYSAWWKLMKIKKAHHRRMLIWKRSPKWSPKWSPTREWVKHAGEMRWIDIFFLI